MFIRNGKATGSILVRDLDKVGREEAPEPVEPEPEPVVEVADEPVEQQPEETVEPPQSSALKAEWVEFAVEQGHSREEAEGLTKQELIDIFGDN